MKKIVVRDLPAVMDPNSDMKGVSVKEVVNRNTVGARRGMVSMAEFAPGGYHTLHRHPASEQITYVMSGQGEHLTQNGPVPVKAGDAVYILRNEWHGFRNSGAGKALLLSMYSPSALFSDVGYESYRGELDTSKPARIKRNSLSAIKGDASLGEDSGFIGLGVYWLATRDTLGTDGFLLGASTFEPGGAHERHRHPHGDEFIYIVEGGGEHLTEDGAVAVDPGDMIYLEADEVHGFKNRPGAATRMLFGYFGPGTLAEAGYEELKAAQA